MNTANQYLGESDSKKKLRENIHSFHATLSRCCTTFFHSPASPTRDICVCICFLWSSLVHFPIVNIEKKNFYD